MESMAAFIDAVKVEPSKRRGPQDLPISETPLGDAFDAVSTFSGASEAQRVVMTAWAAHTHTYRTFAATPRLAFCADGPGCGKTVNMQVTTALSSKPLNVGYASQSSIHCYLDDPANAETTFGLDEIDKVFGSNGRKTTRPVLAAVVNDGYTQKGTALVTRGGKARLIPVFCPVTTAGIGTLPADTITRCIIIYLEQKTPAEVYVPELYEAHLQVIAANLNDWLNTRAAQDYLRAEPPMADIEGSPRFRLISAPLAAIASYAGCHDQFMTALREVQTGIKDNPPMSASAMLISDLRDMWPVKTTLLSAVEIGACLAAHEDGRWRSLAGEPPAGIEKQVAWHLGQAGIRTTVRGAKRGYMRRDVFSVRLDSM